ncbi:MAG TPA: MFS transporter, partial [Denitromonas sp.]|nr:MFS transporter [Denitromonas sp.]
MITAILPVSSLLLGMAILLAGSGLIGTLLGLRASVEGFTGLSLGLIMSGFFAGYIIGAFACPPLIRRIGHIRAFTAMAALAAVVSLLYGMIVNPWVWWVLRVIHGVTMVAIYMIIESWLNEQMHDKRGKIFAAYMMVSFVALGLGQFMIAIYGAEHMGSFALVAIFYSLGLVPIALTPVSQPTPIQT